MIVRFEVPEDFQGMFRSRTVSQSTAGENLMKKTGVLCMAEVYWLDFEGKREFQSTQTISAKTLRGAKVMAARRLRDKENSFAVLGYPTSNGIIHRENIVAVRSREGCWIEYNC